MNDDRTHPPYEPPTLVFLGDLADLTRETKEVGEEDGETFLGLDVGSV